jgi:hypothetical protein
MRYWRNFSVLSVVLAAACAVGVDNGYEPPGRDAALDSHLSPHAGGAKGDGAETGSAGLGGSISGGWAIGDAGVSDALLAVDTATGCIPTQKACGGLCVIPGALVGCGLSGCTPCPSPPFSVARCGGSECDFDCLTGYQRSGTICVPGEGGGAGGGGAGGAGTGQGGAGDSGLDAGPTLCVASQCGGCIPFIQAPCCKADNSCGCQYPFAPCR